MRVRTLVVSLVAAASCFFTMPHAGHALQDKTLGQVDTAGSAQDVLVVGNYAYIADGADGVVVVDISHATAPTIVGSYALPGARRLDIVSNRIYVSTGGDTVTMLSILNPMTPSLLGTFTQAGLVIGDVASDGTLMFITGTLSGQPIVESVDVSNPAVPGLIGSVNTLTSGDIVLSGSSAYIVGGGTFQIINILTTSPYLSVAGTYGDPRGSATYQGVQVFGSMAYINDSALGMHAIAISNPAAPTLAFESATQFPDMPFGAGVAISNGYVFLTRAALGGLFIYDIASTGTPIYVDTYSGAAPAQAITIANDVAYVAADAAGLQLIDISHPDQVPPVVTPVGNTNPTITPGTPYKDPGVTVTDNIGGTGTVVTGTVDTNKVGSYVLTYTVTDRAGNVTVVKRTVIVGPTIENIKLVNNTYTLKVGKKNVVIRPFVGYRGNILARKLVVNTKTDPFYVFITLDATRRPELAIYNASGKQIARQNLTTIGTKGLQVEFVSNPVTLSVLYAIAPRANGLKANIYNISKSGLKSFASVTAAKGTGTLVIKWIKGYTNEYGLATLVKGKTAAPLVWRYVSAKKALLRDTRFDLSLLSWTKTAIKLK